MTRATGPVVQLLLASVLCTVAALATPIPPQKENYPVNAEVFSRPEYVEALAKELEKEEAANAAMWWMRQQHRREMLNEPLYYGESHGNLDQIGGGNLLKRSLDQIGGGNLLRRNLDSIGGGNLVRRNLDSIGGGNLVRRNLDSIGGGNLVRRNLDSIGGGNLLRSLQLPRDEFRE